MDSFVRNFNIRVLKKGLHDFFSVEGDCILELESNTSLFNSNAASILADPFLFVYNDELFLFYEHQDKWVGGKGRICMRKTHDLVNWSEEIDVLEEPFHLSFPFVFEDEGVVYMIPETGRNRTITLYKAQDESLKNWKRETDLIVDPKPWFDSFIFKKDGCYFLFTSRDMLGTQEQHLFISNDLKGPYKQHPSSPIYVGKDGGRNAGSIIEHEGEIYRPVQVCVNSYGEQTSIMRIEEINSITYREYLYKEDIIDSKLPPFQEGGHQFSSVLFRNQVIVAVDYRVRNYNVIELFRKISFAFKRFK